MELNKSELQIVKLLQVGNSLNNKEIAKKLNKDTGNISKKMKQLVEKQVVNKKRISKGKITCNFYSLKDDIENLQQVVQAVEGETSCKKEVSIPSEDIYDPENINLRERTLPSACTEQLVSPKDNFGKTGLEFLNVQGLVSSILKYLSEESEIRLLNSKEKRLKRILSENTKNYTWIQDCIILFLSIAKKIESEMA